MEHQTTGGVAAGSVRGADLTARFPGKYLSLTSFRRNGDAVATPVWFVIEDGRLLVKTDPQSAKVKRIRRNPEVMIASCAANGRTRGEPVRARAELLPASELEHVDQLIARKYRIDKILILPFYRVVQRLRGARGGTAEVAIAILPDGRGPVRAAQGDMPVAKLAAAGYHEPSARDARRRIVASFNGPLRN